MKRHLIIAISMAAVGFVGLAVTLLSHGSVRDQIAKDYRFVGDERAPGGGSTPSKVFASDKPVGATTAEIVAKNKPGDKRITEAGAFLRYRDDVVSVVPAARGQRGSRILVDDEAGGYHRNHSYVGGYWGSYSGPAGSFRGGGPGAGK